MVVTRAGCSRRRLPKRELPQKTSIYGHSGLRTRGTRTPCWQSCRGCARSIPSASSNASARTRRPSPRETESRQLRIEDQGHQVWDSDTGLARRVPKSFVGVAAELAQYGRALAKLKGSDVLIVPGRDC